MPADKEDSQNSKHEADTGRVVTRARAPTRDPALQYPPDLQHRAPRNMPTSATGSSIANSNGKRPIHTISNGNDNMDEPAGTGNGKARQDLPLKTHPTSGYTWSRAEDEPGYAWQHKKAVDEYSRAWENAQHKDRMIKNNYGDAFEIVEKEQAVLASLKQR